MGLLKLNARACWPSGASAPTVHTEPTKVLATGSIPSAPKVSRIVLPTQTGLLNALGVLAAERVYRSRGEGRLPSPVADSDDLRRILALPRRKPPSLAEQTRLAEKWTAILRRERGPNDPCRCKQLRRGMVDPTTGLPCITKLHAVQGWYLDEAATNGGVLGFLAVGSGKTALDILLPMVLPDVDRAILLIPPSLRKEFATAYVEWSEHFKTPNLAGGDGPFYNDRPVLEVLAYSELSVASKRAALKASAEQVTPGRLVIIGDEADKLGRLESVRTGRFHRFLDEYPSRCFMHSGTMTDDSLSDYSHLSARCLLGGSPVPIDPNAVTEWAGVIDPLPDGAARPPVGALRRLCEGDEPVRSAFRKRLVETAGVVTTADQWLPIRLTLAPRVPPPMPAIIKQAIQSAREGIRPDWMAPGSTLAPGEGEELTEALDVAMYAFQIATGWMYRWRFPHGEPRELIDEWFLARGNWNRELREALKFRVDNMDSPELLEDAARRYLAGAPSTELEPTWKTQFYQPWVDIREAVYHEQETVWLDEWLAKDAVKWGQERPGIIWFKHTALGHKIAELGGFAYFGAGKKAEEAIKLEDGSHTIVASISAHNTGRNLQGAFSRNLVVEPSSSGRVWGQLLGRTHRYGQSKDTVTCEVVLHTEEFMGAYANAMRKVEYVYGTTFETNRLLFAEKIGMPDIKGVTALDLGE